MLSLYLSLLDSAEDRVKFERLYDLHKRTMLYQARKILQDEHLAEDAVHNAFLRVIKNFSKIGEIDCPRTRMFLVIIVRNVSLTMLEQMGREVYMEDMEPLADGALSMEEEALNRIEWEKIVGALEELPVLYRDILYLRYVEEYNLTEIAALLDLDRETVKKRAQRGKKKLSALLGAGAV